MKPETVWLVEFFEEMKIAKSRVGPVNPSHWHIILLRKPLGKAIRISDPQSGETMLPAVLHEDVVT